MADLPVRGVYDYFKALENSGGNALELFLAECDREHLTVGVSDALYHVGDTHFKALARTMAVGPECPACRNPPRR